MTAMWKVYVATETYRFGGNIAWFHIAPVTTTLPLSHAKKMLLVEHYFT